MVRIARERIADLFALAERESRVAGPTLADRYVRLARRVGTRYNIRLPAEYRELYCRSCSAYWVEGRSVRTRLRAGRRVRTCLACGRRRRTPVRPPRPSNPPPLGVPTPAVRPEAALAFSVDEDDEGSEPPSGSEEE